MSSETPFIISVPDSQLALLHEKLSLAQYPDEIDPQPGAEWKYGPPLSDIRRLVTRWEDGFDWRKVEAKLNEQLKGLQFTRDIELSEHGYTGTLNVHYVHKKSTAGAIPLLFVHGCECWTVAR